MDEGCENCIHDIPFEIKRKNRLNKIISNDRGLIKLELDDIYDQEACYSSLYMGRYQWYEFIAFRPRA